MLSETAQKTHVLLLLISLFLLQMIKYHLVLWSNGLIYIIPQLYYFYLSRTQCNLPIQDMFKPHYVTLIFSTFFPSCCLPLSDSKQILSAIRKRRKEAFFSALGKPSKHVDSPAKVVQFFYFLNFLHTFYHFLQFCLIFELCRLSLPKFVLGNYKMHLQTTLIRYLTCIICLLYLQMQSTSFSLKLCSRCLLSWERQQCIQVILRR